MRVQRVRTAVLVAIAASLLALAATAGINYLAEREARAVAEQQRDAALRQESLALARRSSEETRRGDTVNGNRLALEALPGSMSSPNRPYVQEAEDALYAAVSNHRQLAVLPNDGRPARALAFSPDGERLVTGFDGGDVMIWDGVSGTRQGRLRGHDRSVETGFFAPDGKVAITAGADNTILWQNISDPNRWRRIGGAALALRRESLSPDGRHIVTAHANGTISPS